MARQRNRYNIIVKQRGRTVKRIENVSHRDVLGYVKIARDSSKYFPSMKTTFLVEIVDGKTGKIKHVRYLKHGFG